MVTIIYVSGRCNQDCIFCCGKHKSKKQYIESRILSPKTDELIISGGEPLLTDDILDILQLCKKNKNIKRVEFQSNGALFCYEDIIDKINSYHVVTEYNINFPSHDEKTDRLQTRSDFFKYRLSGVRNLQKKQCAVRLTYVINKHNYKKMLSFLKFIHVQFAPGLNIQFTFMQYSRRKAGCSIIPKYTQMMPFLLEAAIYAEKNKINCRFENIPLCILRPFYKKSVDYHKSVIDKNSIERKRKIKKCNSCTLNEYCLGIPEFYLKLFGTEEIISIDSTPTTNHD